MSNVLREIVNDEPLELELYGMNSYGYAGNDPVNYIDPTGLTALTIDDKGNVIPPDTNVIGPPTIDDPAPGTGIYDPTNPYSKNAKGHWEEVYVSGGSSDEIIGGGGAYVDVRWVPDPIDWSKQPGSCGCEKKDNTKNASNEHARDNGAIEMVPPNILAFQGPSTAGAMPAPIVWPEVGIGGLAPGVAAVAGKVFGNTGMVTFWAGMPQAEAMSSIWHYELEKRTKAGTLAPGDAQGIYDTAIAGAQAQKFRLTGTTMAQSHKQAADFLGKAEQVYMARKRDLEQIDRIAKDAGGLTKGQRELLHRQISKQHCTEEEIKELAKQIKELYPNK